MIEQIENELAAAEYKINYVEDGESIGTIIHRIRLVYY
ncbi:MAG: hypothetical protein TIS_01500 [Tissierella sp.]|jgi:hypothetical protein